MRIFVVLLAILTLTSCGGRGSPAVSGDISAACMAAGRSAANPALCSCIQAVGNQTLRPGDQSRVASFFLDPERAQQVRASDSRADESFWDRYRNFVDTSRAVCG